MADISILRGGCKMDPITSQDAFKYYQGNCYFQGCDFKKGIKCYKEGLKINPGNIVILYEMGQVYSKLRKHKKALKYWKKLKNLAPHSILGVKSATYLKRRPVKIRWVSEVKAFCGV